MKKILMPLALCILSLSFAADPYEVLESAQPLIGAIESIPNNSVIAQATHIPGYGLQITALATNLPNDRALSETDIALMRIVRGLAPTISGLDQGDWISVSLQVEGSLLNRVLVVRIKPNDPESFEAWNNGKLL